MFSFSLVVEKFLSIIFFLLSPWVNETIRFFGAWANENDLVPSKITTASWYTKFVMTIFKTCGKCFFVTFRSWLFPLNYSSKSLSCIFSNLDLSSSYFIYKFFSSRIEMLEDFSGFLTLALMLEPLVPLVLVVFNFSPINRKRYLSVIRIRSVDLETTDLDWAILTLMDSTFCVRM